MASPPLTLSIGSAEHALRALLERELAHEHLSFAEWTALVFTRDAPLHARDIARQQLAGHIVSSEAQARKAIANLVAAGTLVCRADGAFQHSETGRDLFARVSGGVDGIKSALYGDLPQAELETTYQVLLVIATRANERLAVG